MPTIHYLTFPLIFTFIPTEFSPPTVPCQLNLRLFSRVQTLQHEYSLCFLFCSHFLCVFPFTSHPFPCSRDLSTGVYQYCLQNHRAQLLSRWRSGSGACHKCDRNLDNGPISWSILIKLYLNQIIVNTYYHVLLCCVYLNNHLADF